MKLTTAYICDYKRFRGRHKLDLSGEVIALIGPNEAGKTSVLRALESVDKRRQFTRLERSRKSEGNTEVELHFLLEKADIEAIRQLPGSSQVRRISVTHRGESQLYFELTQHPERDLSTRYQTLERLKDYLYSQALERFDGAPQKNPFSIGLVDPAIQSLGSRGEVLDSTEMESIRTFAQSLRRAIRAKRKDDQFQHVSDEFMEFLGDLEAYDEGTSPAKQIADVLISRMPRCLLFDDPSRNLSNKYDLTDDISLSAPALQNLLGLAKIDVPSLLSAVEQDDDGELEHIAEQANLRLKAVFESDWVEERVVVRLRIDKPVLTLLVSYEDGYSRLDERSDGLMWFVSLRAFLARAGLAQQDDDQSSRPILLVDEAETHLHYDAQAELVKVFSNQHLAQKVIYTTHSAGCLPQDLGTGIRVIEKLPDGGERSKIKNSPWLDNASGIQPVVVGMGATTFSFLPARNVVVCEGMTDAMLYPTLFREVVDRPNLNFQIVPGLSGIEPQVMSNLIAEGGNVVFLLDGDAEGRMLKKKLLEAKIRRHLIVLLGEKKTDSITLEDLIRPSAFLDAISSVYDHYHGLPVSPTSNDIRERPRWNSVKRWAKKNNLPELDKRPVIQNLLDQKSEAAREGHLNRLVDSRCRRKLKGILKRIEQELGKTTRSA